eukprot:scaffold260749_cov30-Tisochrysis_lutea.AAC.1
MATRFDSRSRRISRACRTRTLRGVLTKIERRVGLWVVFMCVRVVSRLATATTTHLSRKALQQWLASTCTHVLAGYLTINSSASPLGCGVCWRLYLSLLASLRPYPYPYLLVITGLKANV